MESIVCRYIEILHTQSIVADKVQTDVSNETSDTHLLWMLHEIALNPLQSETKKHRWLGYVQGVMVCKGYITVQEERELTRPIFNGA